MAEAEFCAAFSPTEGRDPFTSFSEAEGVGPCAVFSPTEAVELCAFFSTAGETNPCIRFSSAGATGFCAPFSVAALAAAGAFLSALLPKSSVMSNTGATFASGFTAKAPAGSVPCKDFSAEALALAGFSSAFTVSEGCPTAFSAFSAGVSCALVSALGASFSTALGFLPRFLGSGFVASAPSPSSFFTSALGFLPRFFGSGFSSFASAAFASSSLGGAAGFSAETAFSAAVFTAFSEAGVFAERFFCAGFFSAFAVSAFTGSSFASCTGSAAFLAGFFGASFLAAGAFGASAAAGAFAGCVCTGAASEHTFASKRTSPAFSITSNVEPIRPFTALSSPVSSGKRSA